MAANIDAAAKSASALTKQFKALLQIGEVLEDIANLEAYKTNAEKETNAAIASMKEAQEAEEEILTKLEVAIESRKKAEQEAKAYIDRAKAQGEEIVAKANAQANEITNEAETQRKQTLDQLEGEQSFLKDQIKLLTQEEEKVTARLHAVKQELSHLKESI